MKIFKRTAFFVIAILLLAISLPAIGKNVSDYDISKYPHPRLLLPSCGKDSILAKVNSDSFLMEIHQDIIKDSHKILKEPVMKEGIVDASDMLSTSREVLKRVFFLSYTFIMTGDKSCAERAKTELVNVANFSSWNPSHYLDVAEMTAAVAIGYDWLYDFLDEGTRDLLAKAIYEKGIDTGFPETAAKPEYTQWLKKKNNWNPVCNTGLSFGAIAAYERDPQKAKRVLDRAVNLIRDVAVPEYAPDGNFPEGYTYWSYGTTYCLMLVDTLKGLFGTDFGISENSGFHKSADYILQMTTQDLSCWDYSDCTSQELKNNYPMFWFANHDHDNSLLWGELEKIEYMKAHGLDGRIKGVRYLPCVLFWAPERPFENMKAPQVRFFVGHGTTPIAIMRNHWGGKDEIFAGLKGGSCLTNHAHMDIGSFVLYRGNKHWIKDLGIQAYYSLTKYGLNLSDRSQNSSRWDGFRLSKDAHNIMTFGDNRQLVEPSADIVSYGDDGDFMFAVTDLSEVDALSVKEHRRGVALVDNNHLVVRDEIVNGSKRMPFRWAAVTAAEVEITGKNTAVLVLDGERMTMKVEGKGVKMGIWSTEPRHIYDEPNPGTMMVGFTGTLKPGQTAEYTVTFIPEDVDPSSCVSVGNLSDWSRRDVRWQADRVADWEMRNFSDSLLAKAHWANGALYKGMTEWAGHTDSQKIDDWLMNIGESSGWQLLPRVYDADDICAGQMYLWMYEKHGKPQMEAAVKERADYVMSHPDCGPLRIPGGKYYRNRWGWCDALFMAPPVYAELSRITGDRKYLDFCFDEYQVTTDSLYNRDDKLFYRDLTLVQDREPNGRQVYWGRGNGWVYASLAIMLEKVPKDHPSYDYYLKMYKEMTESIMALQDEKGSWHSGLYDPESWSSPENSASGFFVYGLAWGVNHGILQDKKCAQAAFKGWNALKSYVQADGKLGYVQAIGHAPTNVTEDMTAVYGAGAFLLAATEIDKMF